MTIQLPARSPERSSRRRSLRRSFFAATTVAERALGVAVLLLVGAALLLPPIAQDAAYHRFADTRAWLGLPNALDVLSNLGFLGAGLWGLTLTARRRLAGLGPALERGARATFLGMVGTAAASSYYHLAPDDGGLIVDRLAMVVVFAGLLAMAAAQRVSERAGTAMLVAGLVAGAASLGAWHAFGTLTPYAALQFGGIALILALLLAPARGPGPHWAALLALYAAAKLLESADAAVFELTRHVVSGHTLKHLVAAATVLAIALPLRDRAASRPRPPARAG